jgi:hypothetical protein
MKLLTQTQKNIISLLQWDDGRMGTFMMECANNYLYHYIQFEADSIIDEIKRSEIFWNWWKDEWAKRDEIFNDMHEGIDKKMIDKWVVREQYNNMHDPEMLASELHPSGVILGESYARMIGKLNDAAKEKEVVNE